MRKKGGFERALPWDKLAEECGIFGIVSHPESSRLTYLGMYALQHRGQESAGIASSDGKKVHLQHGMGRVADVFDESPLGNAQPILIDCWRGQIALAHNGNLVNAATLRRELERDGAIFHSTSDSEVVLHLVSRSRRRTLLEAFIEALRLVQGAYSLLV